MTRRGLERIDNPNDLAQRLIAVLNGEEPGVVVVIDEHGVADFALGLTTTQIRDAVLDYAQVLASDPDR